MDQKDIYRSANLLIDTYGAEAAAHARRRVQDMESRRDVQAAGVWRRILKAIGELRCVRGGKKR